jgi:hypothetical protein
MMHMSQSLAQIIKCLTERTIFLVRTKADKHNHRNDVAQRIRKSDAKPASQTKPMSRSLCVEKMFASLAMCLGFHTRTKINQEQREQMTQLNCSRKRYHLTFESEMQSTPSY